MKPITKFIACVLVGVMSSAYTGNLLADSEQQFSPYQPTPQPEKSFEELKADLERAFRDFYTFWQEPIAAFRKVETFSITDDALSVTFKSAEVFERLLEKYNLRKSDIDFTFRIQYDEFADAMRDGACSNPESVDPKSGYRHSIRFPLPTKINFVNFPSDASFRRACDAIYNIGLRYKEKELQEAARFNELATHYRTLKTKPSLTEPQRRLVVQANALTQERKFIDAIDRYRQLLADDPVVYPAAYYNMALLSAELKLFKRAIRHMNRYLTLMPEANDARAAKDKIYEWELKAEQK